MTRRWLRVAVALAFGAVLSLAAAPSPAAGVDNYLTASDPDRHQELNEEPGWVTLAFASKANAKLAKIVVMDAAGKNVTTGALIVEGTNVTTQLQPGLPKGTYTVMYRTSGSEGRMRGGSFQFAYGKGTWTQEQKEVWIGEEEQPPVLADPDPNPSGTVAGQPGTAAPTSPGAVEPPASVSGPDLTGWLIAAGALVIVVVGAIITFIRRRR